MAQSAKKNDATLNIIVSEVCFLYVDKVVRVIPSFREWDGN